MIIPLNLKKFNQGADQALGFFFSSFLEYGYTCQYNRITKKRGRISRKVSAAAQRLSPSTTAQNGIREEVAQFLRYDVNDESRYERQQCEGTASNGSGLLPPDRRGMTDYSAPVTHVSVGGIDVTSDTFTGPSSVQRSRNSIQQILSPTVQSSKEHGTTASASSPNGPQGPTVGSLYNAIDNPGASNLPTSRGYSSEEMIRDPDEILRERPALRHSITYEPGNQTSSNGDNLPHISKYSYKCLEPILSDLKCILPISAACELLEIYFAEPCGSLFNGASPFILTHVLRRQSVLHPTKPRQSTPALLSTILWCTAQTADLRIFHSPGSRRRISDRLYELSISLLRPRDPDNWHRTPGKNQPEP